jgi:proteoglycan-4
MKDNKKLQIIKTTSLIFTMATAMAFKPTFVLADEGVATAGQFTAGEIEEGEGTIAAPEQPAEPVAPETPAEPTPAVPTPTPVPDTPVAPTPTPEPEAPVTPVNPSHPTEETPAPNQGNSEATGFTINYVDENGNHIYDSAHSTETNPEPKEISGYKFKEKVESTNEVNFVYSLVKYYSTRWEDTDGNVLKPYTIAEEIEPQGEFNGYHLDHKDVDDNGNVLYVFAKDTEAASNNKVTKHAEIETGVRGNLVLSFVTTIASLLTAGYLLVKKSAKQ